MYQLCLGFRFCSAVEYGTWTNYLTMPQSMGLLRVGHDWVTSISLFTFMHWRRKWQPTPVFLPGESQGRGSLVGCRLWGRTELDTWSDLAAAAAVVSSSVEGDNNHTCLIRLWWGLNRFIHVKGLELCLTHSKRYILDGDILCSSGFWGE